MSPARTFPAVAFACLALATASPARAAFIATITEVGADVVLSGSGTINLAGLSKVLGGHSVRPGALGPNAGILLMGAPGAESIDAAYTGFTAPAAFGTTSGPFFPTSGSGTKFGFGPDSGPIRFELDEGLSNVLISSTSTFAGQTLDSLGLTLGTYVWSWGAGPTADTFTLNITDTPPSSSTPEPASLALLAAGLAGLTLQRRRKQA